MYIDNEYEVGKNSLFWNCWLIIYQTLIKYRQYNDNHKKGQNKSIIIAINLMNSENSVKNVPSSLKFDCSNNKIVAIKLAPIIHISLLVLNKRLVVLPIHAAQARFRYK